MPELPEVESVRLGLIKVLKNKKILKIKVSNQKIVSSNSNKRNPDKEKEKEFIKNIENKKIINIKRRAKNLIINLEDDSIILIHLKMTGQLVFVSNKNQKTIGGHPIIESYEEKLPNKHTHIIFKIENGNLFYNDVRKFGYVLYFKNEIEMMKNESIKSHFESIGLEPFDKEFTEKYFLTEIKNKKYENQTLKKVLLEQKIVVGCGNIYTDEICFASKVLPMRLCRSLTQKEIKNIYKNIKIILQNAIDAGGSSISDYLLADGTRGNYARNHKVYGMAGEICKTKKCKNILSKIIIGGRATVFCENCQK